MSRAALFAVCGVLVATSVAQPAPPDDRHADERVLATGTNPRIGSWRITSSRSRELRDAGEVVEPGGLPCLNLLVSDASNGRPLVGRGFCGERARSGLSAAVLPVSDRDGREWDVLFGGAPEDVSGVELRLEAASTRAQVQDGPDERRGDVWILIAKHEAQPGRSLIATVEPDGTPAGQELDMTRFLSLPGDRLPVR